MFIFLKFGNEFLFCKSLSGVQLIIFQRYGKGKSIEWEVGLYDLYV